MDAGIQKVPGPTIVRPGFSIALKQGETNEMAVRRRTE